MKSKKGTIIWVLSIVLFLLGRVIFADILNFITILLFFIYCLSIKWFITPFILGKDIRVPSYSHVLKKGEHDFWRFIYFFSGLAMCVAAIVGEPSF